MKNLKHIAFLMFVMLNGAIYAQNQIAVEHNSQINLYYRLDSALLHSQKGDNIYIPGGSFDLGNGLTIDKSVRIYGVGHYPDSTMATGATILNGNIFIKSGADSGAITGIYVNGNVTFGTNSTNQIVNNYSISRCNIFYLYLSFDGASTNNSQSIYISESIIRDEFHGGNIMGCLVEKNIITHHVRYFNSATFRNNIFLAQGHCCNDYPFTNSSGCLFENNIIRNTDINYMWQNADFGGNTFNNNIFNTNFTFPAGNNNQGNAYNKVNINVDTTFINHTGETFKYTNNYHLRTSSVGKNAGTDGFDIGIYGTASPYKEGAVPANPHIQSKTIAPSTNPNGTLNVKIKVAAQDK